jgi:hypothetical protein
MDQTQVHYEVFSRKGAGAGWKLELATEDRAHATDTANSLFEDKRFAAVRVTKETLDPETREFKTVSILTLGAVDKSKPKKERNDDDPLCVTPQDLYTAHARDRIGRLLENWLQRNHATPFELLHRADLIEKLESSGTELQHAIQKISVPEAQARGCSVHELIRNFQRLIEQAIERVLRDSLKGALPDVDKEGFAAAAERVASDPDRAYLLGAGVAASIAPAKSWSDKVARLLDLADAAPPAGPARALALSVIEQPLAEILGARVGLADLLGHDLDLGANLAAMTRLSAAGPVEMLMGIEPSVKRMMPPFSPPAERLAQWLKGDDFKTVREALGKRVLHELNGPRRLRPSDAVGEIEILRALAMALTAAAGRLLQLEDVQVAFIGRSKMLVTGDFVETYLGSDRSAREEAEALIWLAENVLGAVNKRQAARWLHAGIATLRFEKEIRYGPDTPAGKLARLAELYRAIGGAGLVPEDSGPIQAKLGELAGWIESDAKLVAALAKASAPPVQKLMALLRLAVGEACPLGPVADRARAEAVKMMRVEEVREALRGSPDAAVKVSEMMQAAGLAAA